MSDEFQPYVGPRPFDRTKEDRSRFFGRDDEAGELLSRISAHSAVLFYSQSGAGKTSLINAKLTPMLEAAGFEVLTASMRDVPAEDKLLDQVANIHVFKVLRSWNEDTTDQSRLFKMSIPEYLKERERTGFDEEDGRLRVAIFDQFEEMFTSYQERPEDREGFIDQLSAAFEEDRLLRVLFAMREEYIADLDPYLPWLPERLRTRFRLERLSEGDALLAVTKPLKDTEYSFADGVAEQLVKNLRTVPVETAKGVVKVTGDSVEPVQLQVACKTLWDNCQRSWKTLKPDERNVITKAHLETFGDVDQALSTFYEGAIESAVATGVKEGVLRRWFEKSLITSAGTRGTVFRGQKETGDIPNTAVDELVNQHIIRGELRGGSRWYELTHDRFIAPIRASNERWFLEHSGGAATPKRLEDRAALWAGNNRQKNDLIEDEGELLEAERWLASPAATDVGYTERLLAFVQASRVANNEKKLQSARRLKLLTAALVVVAVLLIIASIFAFKNQRAAEAREREAKKEQRVADIQRTAAEVQKSLAQEQAVAVNRVNSELITERQRADEQLKKAQAREKRIRRALTDLSKDAQAAEQSYQDALNQRTECDKKKALSDSYWQYQQLLAFYKALRDSAGQASVNRRITAINAEMERLDDLACP